MNTDTKPPLLLVTRTGTPSATNSPANSPKEDHNQEQAEGSRSESCDVEPLLTAAQVARWLNVKTRSVYELPLPQVRISMRSLRWRRADVRDHIARSCT